LVYSTLLGRIRSPRDGNSMDGGRPPLGALANSVRPLVVGSCEGADCVEVVEERQGHELGLITGRPPKQTRALEPRHAPQHGQDLGAIVLLIVLGAISRRPGLATRV
jgi:hypothetical protein